MKKLSKRMLSIFLAAVMVFTTVPFTAIVAFAKRSEEPTSYAYLTKNLDGFQSSGSVTWDSTEKAAYFDGGTLSLSNFNAFANVDHDSAFAISFDFKKTSSNPTYGFVFQLDSGSGSNENRFGFNAGGSDDRRGLTYATINSSHNVYWSQDFGSSHTFLNQNNGSWGTSWKPENDTWYNVALFMAGGELQYYLNGSWIGTFNAGSEGSLTNAQIMDNMKNLTTLYVGKTSNTGDGTFRGYVKNLQFFSYAQNDSPAALKTAIDAYEAKMADGKVYKNLSNAYAKYQQASARYDAYVYGELDLTAQTNGTTNSDLLIGASQELALATGAMQPWNRSYANATVENRDSTDTISSTYATSLLYSDKHSTLSDAKNSNVEIQMQYGSNTVALYDGSTEIRIPVSCWTYYDAGTSSRAIAVNYPYDGASGSYSASNFPNDSSEFLLAGVWKGYLDTSNKTWDDAYTNGTVSIPGYKKSIGSAPTGVHSGNRRKWNFFSNYMTYQGGTSGFSSGLKDVQLDWFMFTWYSSSNNRVTHTHDNVGHIYVIDYASALTAINNNKSDLATLGANISSYKEGGAADVFTYFDKMTISFSASDFTSSNCATKAAEIATSLSTGASNIATAISNASADSNYTTLRAAIDYRGTNAAGENISVLAAIAKRTATSTTGGDNNGGYIKRLYKTFALAYDSAKSAMAALADKTVYPSASVSTTASDLENAFRALDVVDIDQPVVTPVSGRLLGPADTISITNPEYNKDNGSPRGSTAYTVAFSDSSTSVTGTISGSTSSATVTPFSGKTTVGLTATVTATASATLSGDSYSRDSAVYTYTLYTPPTVDTDVNYNEGVEITSTNAQTGTIQYSLDNSTWTDYNPSDKYKPFTGNTASTVDLYVRETKTLTDSSSASYTVTSGVNHYVLERNADFDIKAKYTDGSVHEKGANYYDENSHFVIENAGTYSANITYTLYIDGVLDNSYTYDKTNGIAMTSAIENASFIKIIAFATDRATGSTKQTEKTLFNAANFDPMIFHESFNTDDTDGAVKKENSKLWKKDGSYSLYATPSGTVSLETGAGTKYPDVSTESHSWRNNVLKINANSTAPGPVVTFEENPLASGTNAVAARSEGVTISFWRHIEDTSGNTVSLPSSVDSTGYPWRNAIAFQKENDNTAYYIIEVNGVNSRRIDGSNYTDVVPNNQDNTEHEEGNNNGEWEHVAVTINPTGGIHVYTNGVEHDYKYVKVNGTTTSDIDFKDVDASTTASAAEILNFLTASDTQFTLDNGVMYEGNEYNLFLDDIRIYAQTLTQVEINNMYTDEYADVQTNITSNSHDPSSVTVYTLASAIGGKAAGSKVGQEFIDYYEVADSNISSIEYYSFGTGMTIYKAAGTETTYSGDTQIQWDVLGDSEGRCGYQNQELFGGDFHDELADVATYVSTGGDVGPGAGHLVWAPHVMYNLTLNKWVYYAAMSSWGKNRSATFYATSDNPISGYAYQGMIYKSSAYHPNAIDSCVFYGRDEDGKPIISDLYMVIGSWGHAHRDGRYDCIYGTTLNANGSAPAALIASEDTLEIPGTPNSSGVYSYALVRGNTPDLEGGGASPGSGEGAYVQYINGYYYLFVSYGQNEGSYTQRVFRSTTPLGTDTSESVNSSYTEYAGTNGFQANDDRLIGVLEADENLINYVRGNQILSPFDISIYNKIYRSTGHNSVYKAKNADGEWVWVNAVHARPNASKSHNWAAVQDNALAKRQSGNVMGNVCFNNMLGVTENGWLVMFPYQYNGTDSVYKEVKASKLEGLYGGNNMRQQVNSNFGSEYQYTILANEDDDTDTTGVIYGVRDDNEFRMKFKLVRNASGDKVQYIRLYNDSATYAQILADSVTPIHEGVIGVHSKNGTNTYMLATLNVDTTDEECGLQFWAYRMGEIPDVDRVISLGDFVSMDGVIYTHATDAEVLTTYGKTSASDAEKELALKSGYSLYGQEISDNFNYGQKNSSGEFTSGGERYTTLTTKFPAKVDLDKVGNLISLNDTEYCRNYGETGSNMKFVNMSAYDSGSTLREGWWCVKNSNGTFTAAYETDELAAAAVELDPTLELYKVYGITGKVSSFFRYYNNENDGIGVLRKGYPKVGVTLVVAYTDVVTGAEYSEFEFCYVMPNPAWAHTIAATKNNNKDTGNDRNSSYGIYNRFEGSYGEATGYSSSLLYYSSTGSTNEVGWGYGTSGYLTDFSSQSFSDTDLDTLDEIKTLMNQSPSVAAGVNAGSFAAWTHDNDSPNAYTAAPQLISTQYYVDYSDKSNYIKNNPNTGLITTGSNNTTDVPTGYQFKMRTSNFLWANYSGASIFDVTSYSMNKTGLNVTYSSTAADSAEYNKDNYDSSHTDAGIYTANYPYFGTINIWAGKPKRWFDTDMLFHSDERSSNALFSNEYRDKLLFYFSDMNSSNRAYLKQDTVSDASATVWHKGSDYVDGTGYDSAQSRVQIWNYYNYAGSKAYTYAPNGKSGTNTWQGTATFTGKDRVEQNKIEDLNKAYSDTRTFDTTANRLYDGYYYYTDGHHNDVLREDWTSSELYASSNTASSYGRLDVTAENLANYILEMGNYHKVSDSGVGGGRFLGHETYHYYNIGVATCDKGAARDFLENYALKRLVAPKDSEGERHVTLDSNGRPTVDTNMDTEQGEVLGDAEGNLYVADVSAKSYRDYINAIARLEWFVNNPTNTLQNDLASEDEYEDVEAIQSADADEYTTAYASGTAIYKANVTNTDIFGDGTTSTDEVQAQLIADVIEAYENLYTVEDYRKVEEEYKAIKAEVEAAKVTGDYTTASITDYENAFTAIEKAVAYYTDENIVDTDISEDLIDLSDIYDEDFWRYSDYSGADYEAIKVALVEIKNSLMPKVDTSVLSATAAAKAGDSANPAEGTVRYGIYGYVDGQYVQTKRADDWYELYEKVIEADKTQFNTTEDGVVQTKAPDARYVTTETKYIDAIIGTTEREKEGTEYPYSVYRQTTVPSGTAGTATTYIESGTLYVDLGDGEYAVVSDDQKEVNTENHELDAMTIGNVDDNSAYQSYDAAYTIINTSINKDKYLPVAQNKINAALKTRDDVYVTAETDIVDLYATVTGKSDFSEGADLKLTGYQQTDPLTANLLTLANDLELAANKATYVKKFKVTYDVTNGSNTYATQTADVYYGETAEFAIPEEAQANAKFTVTYYDGLYDDYAEGWSGSNATGTVTATYNGTSFSRVAKSNMAITAKVTNKATAAGYKVKICNIYNTVVDVLYCAKADLPNPGTTATFTIGSETISPDEVPFYTFQRWNLSVDDANSEATYSPVYTAGDRLTLTVLGDGVTVTGAAATEEGATTYTTAFDEYVTVDASEVSNFYAWATEITDGSDTKYQIASYSPSYSFYAAYGEKFVPVTKEGETYKVNGGTALTAAMVDSVYDVNYDGDGVITADKILKQKLDDKAPFIATICATMNSSNTAATVYCRVTQGALITPSEYAVLARSKETVQGAEKTTMVPGTATIFKTSTVLSTGQFVYTISKSSAFARRVLFRGYITYDFDYKFTGTNTTQDATATLNIAEYSDFVAQATLK